VRGLTTQYVAKFYSIVLVVNVIPPLSASQLQRRWLPGFDVTVQSECSSSHGIEYGFSFTDHKECWSHLPYAVDIALFVRTASNKATVNGHACFGH
jgi:hypothetical protein